MGFKMSRRRAEIWRLLPHCASTVLFALWSSFALAGNATIAISPPTKDDPFFQSLIGSAELKNADITLSPLIGNQQDNLTKVLAGKADLALVDLDAFKNRKLDGEPLLASFFTRPFLFSDVYQAYVVEDAALGSAALSDISRTGLVGLGYWNKGESQLVTKEKLPSADAIKQLKIGYYNHDDATLVFTKLGASNQELRPEAILDAWKSGTVNAAIVNEPSEKFFQQIGATFVISIRPLVGVLVANAEYWRQLNETQKRAWQRTVSSADMSAKINVQAKAKYMSAWTTFEQIPLPRGKTKAEILSTGLSDDSYVSYQLDLVNEALDANRALAQAPIKKKD
jgi:hypothetical protein